MLIRNSILIIIAVLAFSVVLEGQSSHKLLRKGDQAYKQDNYDIAEEQYRIASQDNKKRDRSIYNLGNAIYQQGRFDESIDHFDKIARTSSDSLLKSNAYHNLGNSYYYKNEFDKSVDSYKRALKLNPEDLETKKNLGMALQQKKIQEQQQEQQQQQQQDQNQDQQEQEQQQQQQQSQGQDQEENQDQQQQQQPQEQQQEGEKQPQADKESMDKNEALQLLDILEGEEKKVQEKLRKRTTKKSKSSKDW